MAQNGFLYVGFSVFKSIETVLNYRLLGKLLIVEKMIILSPPMVGHFFDVLIVSIIMTERQWNY